MAQRLKSFDAAFAVGKQFNAIFSRVSASPELRRRCGQKYSTVWRRLRFAPRGTRRAAAGLDPFFCNYHLDSLSI